MLRIPNYSVTTRVIEYALSLWIAFVISPAGVLIPFPTRYRQAFWSFNMRIAQIAPPWFPIPPIGYGGIERVVYDLTEGLLDTGNEVVLYAPAGSRTNARLVETVSRPVGLNMTEAQKRRHFVNASRFAYRHALELGVDLIHDHTDFEPPRNFPIPIVRTIHGPATPAAVAAYRKMTRRGDRFIAISCRQRDLFVAAAEKNFGPGEQIAFVGVIYNPLDVAAAPFYPAEEKRGYIAFLGRCHWEKSPDGAIRVAQAANLPLMMGLRVTTEEEAYFDAVVRPLVRSVKNLAKLVGEVSGAEKDELIGRAGAVIFPSPWEEPFGLVLAEAAARGTPVVALARGSAPELVIDGVTGILCADEEAMVRAIPAAMKLDPAVCRAHALKLFDRDMIARQHVSLYETLCSPMPNTKVRAAHANGLVRESLGAIAP
jgi:glycosyltransferase involved in cell wall biosynthesis